MVYFLQNLEKCFPQSFMDLLGGIILILVLFFALLLFIVPIHQKLLRVLTIFLVISLSLFANQAWVYFACIFIISTVIVDVDFLENLAAIIRGNDSYFKYKMRKASKEEKKQKFVQDNINPSSNPQKLQNNGQNNSNNKPTRKEINHYLEIEQKALNYEEKIIDQKIERDIVFSNSSHSKILYLDGYIRNKSIDSLYEVKYTRDVLAFLHNKLILERINRISVDYTQITKRDNKLSLIIVLQENQSFTKEIENQLARILNSYEYINEYKVLYENEI